MAYLATLEGEGITLDDLFNVNDYLGVKYFGVDAWNRIKNYACKLTESAANSPIMFCIANCDKDFTKPSELSCALFGFVDDMGVCAMGSTAWNTLKCRLDGELLGGWLTSAVKKVGSGVSSAANVVKEIATAPLTAANYIATETPLKYTPGAYLYNKATEAKDKYIDQPVKDTVQTVTDLTSSALYNVSTKTPLKYTGIGQIMKLAQKAREAAGITSKGTAQVYESDAAKAEREASEAAEAQRLAEAAARGAAKAAEKASQQRTAGVEQAKIKKEQATTQKALEVMENRAESKYKPIVMAGVFGLLALAVLKK